ncbi:MAG: lipase family protein [Opitutaceae bacterium]|nr:lipase family protein [Opitutaceae bacterium]
MKTVSSQPYVSPTQTHAKKPLNPHLVNRITTVVLLVHFLFLNLGAQNELSHEALFAPNKTFPYFENCPLPTGTSEKIFDIETARFLAQASLLSYVKAAKFIKAEFIESGFSDVRFFDNEGTFAFIAVRDDALVLVFRGTESGDQRDYVTDGKIIQNPFLDYGTAHQGFIQALDWIDEDVDAAIEFLLAEKPRQLWISGHSLGGALATLYALRHPEDVTAVYTMGAPRIGGVRFAENAAKTITLYRLANDNDIIPRLPTPPFYKHIGKTYFITSSLELKIDPPFAQKWESRRAGHANLIETLFKQHWLEGDFQAIPSDYIVDHSPRLYAEALAAIVSVEAE